MIYFANIKIVHFVKFEMYSDIVYIMFKLWTLLLRLFVLSYWLKVIVGGVKRLRVS